MILSLLANTDNRLYNTKMFNDQIMTLYLVMCIYYAVSNCPMTASFFLSMGMGVKAGLLLIIPGFLGSIQLNYGLSKLVLSVLIIVGF